MRTRVMLANLLLLMWLAVPATMSQDLAKSRLGLYVNASEAYQMLQQQPNAILVDVRDPVEVKFTGFATPTRIHVPWLLTDTGSWSEENASWPMRANPNFDKQILSRLDALGADENTPIIIMCRSGATRSAPAADRLADYGYSNVWSVTDGFEGSTLKEGRSKGVRAVNGWRNSGLPWSYKLPADIAWQQSKE